LQVLSSNKKSIPNQGQKIYIITITDRFLRLNATVKQKKVILKFTIDAFYVLFVNFGQNGFLKPTPEVAAGAQGGEPGADRIDLVDGVPPDTASAAAPSRMSGLRVLARPHPESTQPPVAT
jgi:hypothetical protein